MALILNNEEVTAEDSFIPVFPTSGEGFQRGKSPRMTFNFVKYSVHKLLTL